MKADSRGRGLTIGQTQGPSTALGLGLGLCLCLGLGYCGCEPRGVIGALPDAQSATDGARDAAVDDGATDGAASLDPRGPFEIVVPVAQASSDTFSEEDPALSADETVLYLARAPAGIAARQIYRLERATAADAFSAPQLLSFSGAGGGEMFGPALASGDDALWLTWKRSASAPHAIFRAARIDATTFAVPDQSQLNDNAGSSPALAGDGLTMIFERWNDNAKKSELVMVERLTRQSAFGPPKAVPIQTWPYSQGQPWLNHDATLLYLARDVDGQGNFDLYVATRADRTKAFSDPLPLLGAVNTAESESGPWVSADGQRLYFSRSVGGVQHDLLMARRR